MGNRLGDAPVNEGKKKELKRKKPMRDEKVPFPLQHILYTQLESPSHVSNVK